MKAPKQGEPAQVFTLRNTAGKDVRFKGWKLAGVDNFNPQAVDKFSNLATGSTRWKERAVYQTESGKIVCHKLGCSRMPGEVDRGEVLVINPRASAIDVSVQGGPHLLVRTGVPQSEAETEEQVANFFGNDPLAKDLLAELGIDDVENID